MSKRPISVLGGLCRIQIRLKRLLVTAVNRGHDTDTVGAVTGQLAGRIYDCYAIPDWMFDGLYEHDQIRYLSSKLHDLNK